MGDARPSGSFDTKAEAVAWAAKVESELRNERRGIIVPHSVTDALTRYRERESPKHRGEHWEAIRLAKLARTLPFRLRDIADVRRDDIAAWRDAMLETLAASSARREYGLLRAVFNVAKREWHWLHDSPFDGVSPPAAGKPRTRRVSDDEIDRLMLALNYERGTAPETASQFIAVAVLLALETAMRQGELLSLTPADIEGRVARLAETKNGDPRAVPLSKAALTLLELLPEEGDLIPVAVRTFDTLFRRARDRAGLRDLHFHDLRREATTRLAMKLDVLTLAKMTGHKDVKVLLATYYQPDLADVAARLD